MSPEETNRLAAALRAIAPKTPEALLFIGNERDAPERTLGLKVHACEFAVSPANACPWLPLGSGMDLETSGRFVRAWEDAP